MLFTDIEGSTALLERHGEVYADLLTRHRDIVRTAFRAHSGIEHGTEGDSFFVSFHSVSDAVAAAVHAQHALQHEEWPGGAEVSVRMGLHTGEVTEHDEGLIGLAVHQAARVANTANGGQIVITDAVRLLATGLDGITTTSRGHYRIRDLGLIELHQVQSPSIRSPMTALRASAGTRSNLPRQATQLHGRDAELRSATGLLRTAQVVNIVGTGGIGKTSLALEAARMSSDEFDGGTWWVELQPIEDGGSVLAAVTVALSVVSRAEGDPITSIADWIGGRRTLVVLDNCEHVLDSCRRATERLVTASPSLVVVATSRSPLGVRGERVLRLGPLVPATDAVDLFVERATHADSSFDPTAADLVRIANICARLDGLPLAIELAAARVRSLSTADIEAKLDDRFKLLRDTGRGDGRSRTLQATVDWSYRMLGADERTVFERLSVFNGTVDLRAVEGVCDDGTLELEITDIVQSLVDRSMVVADRRRSSSRFRMLETMRDYATGALDRNGEPSRWRDRHLAHFLRATEQAERELLGPEPRPAMEWFEDHWDDIRGAFRFALHHRRLSEADRLLVAAAWFATSTLRDEHYEWLLQLHERDGVDGQVSVSAFGAIAYWEGTMMGNEESSLGWAEAGLARATDPHAIETLWCWTCLPFHELPPGSGRIGRRYGGLLAVLERMSDPADDWRVAIEVIDAAQQAGQQGHFLPTMRAIAARHRSPVFGFYNALAHGHDCVESGNLADAGTHYRSALDQARDVGDVRLTGAALRALALAAVLERSPTALGRCLDAVDVLYESRYWQKLIQALRSTTLALALAGRTDDAASLLLFLDHEGSAEYGLEATSGVLTEARRLVADSSPAPPDALVGRAFAASRDDAVMWVLSLRATDSL